VNEAIERFAARVLEYKDCPFFVASERQRPHCPCGIEFGCKRIFVLKSPERLRRRPFRGECHCQDRRWVAGLSAAVKSKVGAFPEGF
jgi:hypothetical protein